MTPHPETEAAPSVTSDPETEAARRVTWYPATEEAPGATALTEAEEPPETPRHVDATKTEPALPYWRRPLALALAAVVLVAATVTGTYTYTNFIQHAVNEFAGSTPPGLRLHDDYTEVLDATVSNKDVYVENYGSVPQFVRIRLTEFMALDGKPLVEGQIKDNPETWAVHLPHDADGNGEVDGGAGDDFHSYWSWVLGGQKFYMPTTNHAQLGDANTDDDQFADDADNNPTIYNGTEEGVRETDPETTVVTMAYWQNLMHEGGPYWVWDEDGWAYWAEALQPGEATSLLLSEVDLMVIPDAAEYYYAIDAQLEGVTANEVREGKWFAEAPHTRDHANPVEGLTESAKVLLATVVQSAPQATAVQLSGPKTLAAGASATLSAHVQPLHQAAQFVTWSLGAGFGTVTLTPAADGLTATLTFGADVRPGDVFTVTAASADNPAVAGTFQVTVAAAAAVPDQEPAPIEEAGDGPT
jgi:hypothetical protein